MLSSLILAATILTAGQCPGGQCPRPATMYVHPSPQKAWYALVNVPGYLGYGGLNAQGQVVVEQYRAIAYQPAAPACNSGRCPYR